MFLHLLKYKFKMAFREKSYLFWNIAWPIILITMISFVISNFSDSDYLNTKTVATNSPMFEEIAKNIKIENRNLFKIIKVDNVDEALKSGDIEAYITEKNKFSMKILKQNYSTQFIKETLDLINQKTYLIENSAKEIRDNNRISNLVKDMLSKKENYVIEKTKDLKGNMVFAYAILSMIALGAAPFAISDISQFDIKNGYDCSLRNLISPVNKRKQIIINIMGSLIINVIACVIYMLYSYFILNIAFPNSVLINFLIIVIANIIGMSFGIIFYFLLPFNAEKKMTIVPPIYVVSCFIAGLMSPYIAYLIESKFPPTVYLNPATVITKLFYSSYYYGIGEEFIMYVRNALVFTTVLMIISFLLLGGFSSDKKLFKNSMEK